MFEGKIETASRAHSHDTRYNKNALPVSFRSTFFQKQIDNAGPKIYNKLPEQIKNNTFKSFKTSGGDRGSQPRQPPRGAATRGAHFRPGKKFRKKI